MNIQNLRAQTEVELEAVQNRRRKAKAEIELILDEARKEGRPNLTPDEQQRTDELFNTIEMGKAQEKGVFDKLARIKKIEAEEAEFDARMNEAPTPANLPATRERTASVQVGREARTYSRETDPQGKMFFSDVVNQFLSNDVRAADRLGRHIREEQVERSHEAWQQRSSSGVGTGAFSGLTVPQYLLDMVAPAVANMRPFANKANGHPLPANGMSVNISRITTPSTAGLQASELAAVAWQDMDDTLLTIPIQTAAGQQLVSRQAIERGQGVEDVILQDLMKRYHTVVDNTLINQATVGLAAVSNGNTYTSGAPLATELYPLIVGSISQSATATRGLARPDFALMHPRRWYWMQGQMANTWPVFGQPGIPARNIGTNNNQDYNGPGYDGMLPCGVGVIADANVVTNLGAGTNQDAVYVGSLSEVHLWEDAGAPVFIRAEQPAVASLGVNLVVYGYFAFTMQRYALAYQALTGTGLIAPSGF